MSVNFDTYEYEASHGTRPKGKGWWAFMPNAWVDDRDLVFINEWLTLAEAKRRVKEQYPNVRVWQVAP